MAAKQGAKYLNVPKLVLQWRWGLCVHPARCVLETLAPTGNAFKLSATALYGVVQDVALSTWASFQT